MRCQWKKIGKGSLRFRDQTIRTGQVFEAEEEEIPRLFLHMLQKVRHTPIMKRTVVAKVEEEAATVPKYEVQMSLPGWYDIVNVVTGKAMNAKRLRQKDAVALLQELQQQWAPPEASA